MMQILMYTVMMMRSLLPAAFLWEVTEDDDRRFIIYRIKYFRYNVFPAFPCVAYGVCKGR